MARSESRKSIGVFAVIYLGLALVGGVFFWTQLKPAFDSIGGEEAPAVEVPQEQR